MRLAEDSEVLLASVKSACGSAVCLDFYIGCIRGLIVSSLHNARYRALAFASPYNDLVAVALLPRPDPGWRNLVAQTHLNNVSSHATSRAMSPNRV